MVRKFIYMGTSEVQLTMRQRIFWEQGVARQYLEAKHMQPCWQHTLACLVWTT